MTDRGGGRASRPGPGGRTKSGKPRPGTGGQGKRRLEGRGPTPPGELRPGHPAQRNAAARARAAARADGRERGQGAGPAGASGRERGQGAGAPGASGRERGRGVGSADAARYRGSGAAAEFVAGRNAVLEALQAGVPATALHVGPRLDADERIGRAVRLAADARVPVVEAGRAELDRLTGGAIHQGLALRVRPYSYAHPGDLIDAARAAGTPPLIVALDQVTDPRNLGAVVRSVAAFGGHGVLIPSRRSAGVTAGAWKASAGTLARVPVARAPNLARALADYRQAALFVVGLDPAGPADIGTITVAGSPLVLVIGGEGAGLSRLVADGCDLVAAIPTSGPAESLNAGIAAAIALYAVSRLRAS
jgi:23S rRNA (guanosine2251-2'-O)-methyltransferase